MEESIVVGIDVGTTKICTLIARIEGNQRVHVLGAGIEQSQGMKKGVVVDISAASRAIRRSIEKAERSSGFEVTGALVSLAGSNVSSVNSKGVVGISGDVIDEDDVFRALEAARAVAIPHNREIIHVIQRGFNIDGQSGIRTPIGMHGYRLEVEAHIITASAAAVENLRQCVANAGVEVTQFVLNPLASAEAVLNDTERQMGAVLCDIGGGTTNIAIYIEGDIWHTAVLGVGGDLITSDIAHGLRLPLTTAEEIKKQHGHALQSEVSKDEYFTVKTFGEDKPVQISRADLAYIIEARMEEICALVLKEIKRSNYDGLLPAGIVFCGGASAMPGLRMLANRVFDLPARVAQPEGMTGMIDKIQGPAFATSIGIIRWAMLMNEYLSQPERKRSRRPEGESLRKVRELIRLLLP